LHQDHKKADVASLLLHCLVIAITDVFGDSLIEDLLIAVAVFPGDRDELRAPWLEQRLAFSINGPPLFGADDMRLDSLAGNAADVRELLRINQGDEPMKGVRLALVRGCRKQQQIGRSLSEPLPQLEASHLVGAASKPVRFVDNHQIPTSGD
jgi:hypothetical protein